MSAHTMTKETKAMRLLDEDEEEESDATAG